MTIHPRLHLTRRGRLVVAMVAAATLTVGAWVTTGALDPDAADTAPSAPTASPRPSPSASPSPPDLGTVERRAVTAGSRWVDDDIGAVVVAAADGLLDRAPVVVLATRGAMAHARGIAWRLRAPVVPAGAPGLEALLVRWDTTTVVVVEQRPTAGHTPTASPSRWSSDAEHLVMTVEGSRLLGPDLDHLVLAAPPRGPDVRVLVRPDDPAHPLLAALAHAADTTLVPVVGELVDDAEARRGLRAAPDASWAVAGTASAWADTDAGVLAWDVTVVRSGVELPGGGLRLFPDRLLIALYGSPDAASLGVLGEQSVEDAVGRARDIAAPYAALTDVPVVPTFEIITTVASGAPAARGDYSHRVPLDRIEPWIDAAEAAGIYVILDLQPGRTDFLSQAKEIAPLLRRPHVGLALDPEWRLTPDQVHLRQVGSVAVEEVQAVADWLAELTHREGLPQKLLLLHQFTLSMIRDRAQLQVPPQLAVAIQMDGQGSQGAKDATWQAVTTMDPPADVWFGWKNFYDEDTTLRSPADTLAVEPSPVLVSYQ